MKTRRKELLGVLNRKDLNKLTNVVKETIFIESEHRSNSKQFTSAELWRIQKMKKPVRLLRH